MLDILRCPQDAERVTLDGDHLECPNGHRYLIVDGIPVMLFDDKDATHAYIKKTLDKVARIENGEQVEIVVPIKENKADEIDEYVAGILPYTCGNMYFPAQRGISRYPFPELRMPDSPTGELFLDIGCNWGRWSIAAAKKGYRVVGIDPSLKAVQSARRIARQLNENCLFVVGDARCLPFTTNAFDTVFSFGVFQHFSKENTRIALDEIARVLKPNQSALVQMATSTGIRCRQNWRRRGYTEGEQFEVRYWSPSELMETWETKLGKTEMFADSYFSLCAHRSDADLMPFRFRLVVYSSDLLRRISQRFKPLIKVADGVYLRSINNARS